jgi:2-polyprenyl-6-methoxyphenol hydroxylase-like FAD-dependent oxidoreductase
MAGLLAARVLSTYFKRVTVLERDSLEDDPNPRKGVPQGRHAHALLSEGADIMEELFPGLFQDMMAQGVKYTDMAADWVWFHYGVWKSRIPSRMHMYFPSRPFLDWNIRKRLQQIENVEVEGGIRVDGYVAGEGCLKGVRVIREGSSETTEELADLIVDASGRGTRTPSWLEDLGYGKPAEDRVDVQLGHASRLISLPEDLERDWEVMVIYPKAPETGRIGYLFPIEQGRHLMGLAGYCGDYPPIDEDGFMEFARSLRPEYYDAVKNAKHLSPIAQHRIACNLRRRYETMPRFPHRLVVMGDALCSFDPVFGQGMTTAALGAKALQGCLEDRQSGDLDTLSSHFFDSTVPFINLAWLLATTEDMRFPQLEGKRPFGMKFLNWFKAQLFELSSTDGDLNRRFLEVLNFKKGLTNLMTPRILARVVGRQFTRARGNAGMPSRITEPGS